MYLNIQLPYKANVSKGKTFAVVHKTHSSLENFCDASGRGHHLQYTAIDSGENFHSWLKSGKNSKSFSTQIICRVRYTHSLNPTSSCGLANTKLMTFIMLDVISPMQNLCAYRLQCYECTEKKVYRQTDKCHMCIIIMYA